MTKFFTFHYRCLWKAELCGSTVDYVNNGILGALAAKASSSVATVVLEVTSFGSQGSTLFVLKAGVWIRIGNTTICHK